MLPLTEIAAMTAVVTASLDQEVTIERVTRTPDGYGSAEETWATLASTVCNLAKPGGSIMQSYASVIGSQVTWQVRLPVDTDIQRGDRLVIGTKTLEVQALLDPVSYTFNTSVLASEVV